MKITCPTCQKTNSFALYENGYGRCYYTGCPSDGRYFKPDCTMQEITPVPTPEVEPLEFLPVCALKARGITQEVCFTYQYRVAKYKGQLVQAAQYGPDSYKIRTQSKGFFWHGTPTTNRFFGHHLLTGKGTLLITEGELDAMSVATSDPTVTAVSLPGGVSSVSACFKAFDFTRYSKVILWFDKDDAGVKALEEAVTKMGAVTPYLPGKTPEGCKDASDVLVKHGVEAVRSCVQGAALYKPANLIDLNDIDWKQNMEPVRGYLTGFPCIDEKTLGLRPGELVLLTAGSGAGKCLGIDTPILMYDGTIKPVQDVRVGDLLMGDDSTPRTVFSLARGREDLYKIKPIKGDDWVCNSSHVLSFVMSNTVGKYLKDTTYDVPLNEFIKLPENIRIKAKQYRVPVEFQAQEIDVDPYYLGVWLGDGCSRNLARTSLGDRKKEISDWLMGEFAPSNNLTPTLTAVGPHGMLHILRSNAGRANSLAVRLSKYNLKMNKHIPYAYKVNTRDVQLQVLAGLLDTDGHLNKNGGYEITQKSKQLSEDIVFMVRSLGLSASMRSKIWQGKQYYAMYISGDCSIIPCKVVRKQEPKRNLTRNVLRTGFTVEPLGEGDYYGFEIDGNKRFLLGDFSVTHNTTLAHEIGYKLSFGEEKLKAGYIFLEESVQKSAQHLVALHNNVPLHRLRSDPTTVGPDKMVAFQKHIKDNNIRVLFYDHFGSLASDKLLATLENMVTRQKCQYIILDHISIALSGLVSSREGERKDLDILVTALAQFVVEHNILLIAICHLTSGSDGTSHEEGGRVTLNQLRGSGILRQASFTVIAAERNQQGPNPNHVYYRILKCRETGYTGGAGVLYYEPTTGRLVQSQMTCREYDEIARGSPSKGKSKSAPYGKVSF